MVEQCCTNWMKVGYVLRRKYEVFICPVCGKIYFSPELTKWGKFIVKLFMRRMKVYDEKQLRLYWDGMMPVIIADPTGAAIKGLELAEWENKKKKILESKE